MKPVQIRNYNGKVVPYDSYDAQILQRLEHVTTAQNVGYGFIIQSEDPDSTVRKLLDNFSRNNNVEVYGLAVANLVGTTFFVTVPESHFRQLSYLLHEDDSLHITEYTDLEMMFKLAAPITATRRLHKGRRPKSRLLLAAAK